MTGTRQSQAGSVEHRYADGQGDQRVFSAAEKRVAKGEFGAQAKALLTECKNSLKS